MGRMAGVRFPAEATDCSLLHSIQTGSRAHPASYPMGVGNFSPGVKRPDRDTNHSPPSSAEVKNGGTIPPLPPMSHGLVLNSLIN
jgi:hypothetical protein